MLAIIPERDACIITLKVVSIFIAPRPESLHATHLGTALNVSSDIEAINGKIITPTTIAPLIGFTFGGSSIQPFA